MNPTRIFSRRLIAFACLFIAAVPLEIPPSIETNSWAEVQQKKEGVIVVYWYESRPFIFKTPDGQLQGIEYGLIKEFQKFVREKYQYDLKVIWKEAESFAELYQTIRDGNHKGYFGCSAFSVTEARKKEVSFSPSYMSDICVLVTSDDVPLVQSPDEFNSVFDSLTAITIDQTTYESDLEELKDKANLSFEIKRIPSSHNIIRTIEKTKGSFGFIDLPVYMMLFKENPMLKVRRQNLFTIKRLGYAFPLSRNSDWVEPLEDFLSSRDFNLRRTALVEKYIDHEVLELVQQVAIDPNELVLLLTKEKEIQYNNLLGKAAEIQREARTRNFLIAFAAVVVFCLAVIAIQYRKRSIQQRRIEVQQQSIELKNKQLERRNRHLVELDQEKNNLIKILAHDLRTPINHVQGLAEVFLITNKSLPDEQKLIIDRISDASARLNKMISNILDIDSIENNRVKVNKEKILIGPLVENVVGTFEKEASKKDLRLVLSQKLNGCLLEADPLFITQILENLISNALKFSHQGQTVEIIAELQDENIEISIKDSGPGLTNEDMKLLFVKFQRLSAKPTAGENSTGLGLSIVKRYVEIMGGKVWCQSDFGHGATFTISFPKAN